MGPSAAANAARVLVVDEPGGPVAYLMGRLTLRASETMREFLAQRAVGVGTLTEELSIIQATPLFKAVVVWCALYRYQPGFTLQDALRVSTFLQDSQFFGVNEWLNDHEIRTPHKPTEDDDEPPIQRNWGKFYHDLCQANPGWTYDTVADLTWDQFRNACQGGKTDTSIEDPMPGEVLSADQVEQLKLRHRANKAAQPSAPETEEDRIWKQTFAAGKALAEKLSAAKKPAQSELPPEVQDAIRRLKEQGGSPTGPIAPEDDQRG